MQKYNVKLYIYDLSNGSAKKYAPYIIGKNIEGIWHTGVVIYSNEYFYGGGICHLPINQFSINNDLHPTTIIDMGYTTISKDIFNQYLSSINEKFTHDKYNILSHNCNHFTNNIINFLTGNNIPDFILNQADYSFNSYNPFAYFIKKILQIFDKL